MNICVIGTGYVGLVTGCVFSDLGNEVVCVDKNADKIAKLNRGEMPIYEPGLEDLVRRNTEEGRLLFTTNLVDAVRKSEVVFICVGTPPLPNGEPDMHFVEGAAKEIAQGLNGYKVIVNKSTVPVGTGNFVRETIEQHRQASIPFDVVSNPEFLREGSAIQDTLHPDRVIIGSANPLAAEKVQELYRPLECPILITDLASAEMIKYASNSFLATKISFINAVATVCEEVGADIQQVIRGMGSDQRIGIAFLNAGLGYGGSCFPKDCYALWHTAQRTGYDFHLLKAVMDVNHEQPLRFLSRVRTALGGSLEGKRIGILGLAFKPNTDDIRDAKSLEIITELLAERAEVQAYDPIAIENTRQVFPQITYAKNAYDTALDVDALLVVTEWNEFKQLNMERIKFLMKQPVLFDGRNIYDPDRMREFGFDYYCVGRADGTPVLDKVA